MGPCGPAGCPGKSCENVDEICLKLDNATEACRVLKFKQEALENALRSSTSSSVRCLLQKQIQSSKNSQQLLQTKIRKYSEKKNELSN
jgi:hypothetical protein